MHMSPAHAFDNSCTACHRPNKLQLGTPRKIGQGCMFYSFTTNTYKMHFLESPSGIKVSDGLRRLACTCYSMAAMSNNQCTRFTGGLDRGCRCCCWLTCTVLTFVMIFFCCSSSSTPVLTWVT